MAPVHNEHIGLHKLWASMASILLGLTVAASILFGMGPHPISVAASAGSASTITTTTVTASKVVPAVEQYLDSMPADFYTIGTLSALKSLIAQCKTLLIDVRNPSEYTAGHIAGAINIPLNDLELHLDAIPVDQDVVLYCSTGYRSAMGVMALRLQGFDRVRGFPPSFAGWQAANEPVTRSEPTGKAQA